VPADAAVVAGIGVQRLLGRAERVEEVERGLPADVLVVPWQQELDRDGDPAAGLDEGRADDEAAAGIRGPAAISGMPIVPRCRSTRSWK
jgi:hypothetical protein